MPKCNLVVLFANEKWRKEIRTRKDEKNNMFDRLSRRGILCGMEKTEKVVARS